MTGDEIRRLFRAFFEEKGHLPMPSGSLIPVGDPTLLLTSAGMVPFKPYFTGEATPPRSRLTTCQKCFRTSDIDIVGDTKHLTFFEMLGNFSIGDYFKREVIPWAWELLTQRMGLPADRLWVTVFVDDDEAFHLWRDVVGVPEERIYRYGRSDNFWGPAGSEGPCGPCSEIHYDFGAERGCRPMAGPLDVAGYKTDESVGCHPNCDRCGRFVELWNLVFMQFYQHLDGTLTPLPKPNIDTGMGLERAAAILQGVDSVYDTDLFSPIVARVAELAGKRYGADHAADEAIRVVAEHSRAITFLVADGVVPGNEGRGYVLRRLIRRAVYRARTRLVVNQDWMVPIARKVIEVMSGQYPELLQHSKFIFEVLNQEEQKFIKTMQDGRTLLEGVDSYRRYLKDFFINVVQHPSWRARVAGRPFESLYSSSDLVVRSVAGSEPPEAIKLHIDNQFKEIFGQDYWTADISTYQQAYDVADRLSGKEMFILWDTYGFPIDLTREIALERGLIVTQEAMQAFEREMEQQRQRARASDRFDVDVARTRAYEALGVNATPFTGYDTLLQPTVVVGLLVDGQPVARATEGQRVEVVLRESPFYPEGGGQAGDGGDILGPQGLIQVEDTQRPVGDLIVHVGQVAKGAVEVGDLVEARVDRERRLASARNHTGTHLLHAALRQVLGAHVRQAGSLLAPDRLRFDFSSPLALTQEELERVERLVNEKIRDDLPVRKHQSTYQAAVAQGALAFFGEKYADQVRVVEVANPDASGPLSLPFSLEVCGGTHLDRTGQIGAFVIISESSIGSGMRRIEAATGAGAEAFLRSRLNTLQSVADLLQTTPGELEARAKALLEELDQARKRAEALSRQASRGFADELLRHVTEVAGLKVLVGRVEASSVEALREVGDWLRDRLGSGVVVLGAVLDGRPTLVAMVTADLVAQGVHAGNIVREAAKVMDGSGGGRPNLAQAGGRRPEKLDDALAAVPQIVASQHPR